MSTAPAGFDLPERVGRYQLGPVVGIGGFAVVVRAYDEGLATDVAVKVLHRSRALDPEMRERFVREARLMRRVRDPSVVAVHDVGETPDGLPYFVMDLAAGGVLQDRLAAAGGAGAAGAVHAEDLRAVVATLAEGLAALHRASVVHRDVKPSNLLVMGDAHRLPGWGGGATARPPGRLLADDERLVIGDLGLAKDQDATALGPTVLGGTPRYQAPEQTELGAPIDARTDVYAATAVVWRVVTGQPPPTPDELPVAVLGLPEGWRSVLARGLAARPDDRFPSMADWGAAVLQAVGEPTAAMAAAAAAGPSAVAVEAGATCPYKGLAAFQPADAPFSSGGRSWSTSWWPGSRGGRRWCWAGRRAAGSRPSCGRACSRPWPAGPCREAPSGRRACSRPAPTRCRCSRPGWPRSTRPPRPCPTSGPSGPIPPSPAMRSASRR